MTRRRIGHPLLLIGLLGLGGLAIVEAFRGFVDISGGSLRAPLIFGAVGGMLFIIVGWLGVSRADRRVELSKDPVGPDRRDAPLR